MNRGVVKSPTMPCRVCGAQTRMLFTGFCDGCYEARKFTDLTFEQAQKLLSIERPKWRLVNETATGSEGND